MTTNQKILQVTKSLNELIDIAVPLGYDFYARMDADDIALPQRFEKQLRYFSEHEQVDVLGSACVEIDAHGRELGCLRKPLANSELRAGLPLPPRRKNSLLN
ncbi:MAG: hypothetical protein ACLP3R_13545 [Candidatus Korobacteraceae bacterium]